MAQWPQVSSPRWCARSSRTLAERGVTDVSGGFGLVQIVSFSGRFPTVIEDAVRRSTLVVSEDSPLKIVPIHHLIALQR